MSITELEELAPRMRLADKANSTLDGTEITVYALVGGKEVRLDHSQTYIRSGLLLTAFQNELKSAYNRGFEDGQKVGESMSFQTAYQDGFAAGVAVSRTPDPKPVSCEGADDGTTD